MLAKIKNRETFKTSNESNDSVLSLNTIVPINGWVETELVGHFIWHVLSVSIRGQQCMAGNSSVCDRSIAQRNPKTWGNTFFFFFF